MSRDARTETRPHKQAHLLKLPQILSKLPLALSDPTMDLAEEPPLVTPDAERPDASIDVTHSLEYWNSV